MDCAKLSQADEIEDQEGILQKVKEQNISLGKHEFEFNNHIYIGYPTVYSPQIFSDTFQIAQNFPFPAGGSFLEIGTGCGLIVLEAAFKGCKKVVGTDISEESISNSQENLARFTSQLKDTQVEFYISDIFSAIPKDEKYNTIFWNFPCQLGSKPHDEMDMLERAFKDTGYILLKRYFQEIKDYLEVGGNAYLCWHPAVANKELFQKVIDETNIELVEVSQIQGPNDVNGIMYMIK
ncbi:methyltransferase small [Stylonychia lemnae]|uniref:Methyltransferase small n=1 Tax=Stylonychia lemnae TaxID=5949 RepID=A0A077ZYG3_STYLE|nr:methyltransferase small [Stylonychia lemnae]|eukprot:CDW74910.1 methyltransferase small [Stylonychia lemnae]